MIANSQECADRFMDEHLIVSRAPPVRTRFCETKPNWGGGYLAFCAGKGGSPVTELEPNIS